MKYADTRLNQYAKENPEYQKQTLNEIARETGVHRSTISRHLKKLREKEPVNAKRKKRGYRKGRIQYLVDFVKQYFKNDIQSLISETRNSVFLIIPIEPYFNPIIGDVVDNELIEIR